MTTRAKVWIGAAIAFVIAWLLHPFYVRNLEAVMEERGWDQFFNRVLERVPELGAGMSSYLSDLFSGTFWLGALIVLLIWGCFEIYHAKRRRSMAQQPQSPVTPMHSRPSRREDWPPDADGLYVGYMRGDVRALRDDLLIRIAIRVFNATGNDIAIRRAEGNARYVIFENGKSVEKDSLPAPQLVLSPNLDRIANYSEALFHIEQRVKRAMSEDMLRQLDTAGKFELCFDGVRVVIEPADYPELHATLPLWPCMTFFSATAGQVFTDISPAARFKGSL